MDPFEMRRVEAGTLRAPGGALAWWMASVLALGGFVVRGDAARAQEREAGAPIDFSLEETSGQQRSMQQVRGRVVLVFYEDRGHTDTNRDFKYLMHQFVVDNHLGGETTTYAVANIGSLGSGVIRDMARVAIRAFAAQYGIQILLDWDGALQRAPISMRDAAANTVLVDRAGRVRWHHVGAIGEVERRSFFRMFRALLREDAARP